MPRRRPDPLIGAEEPLSLGPLTAAQRDRLARVGLPPGLFSALESIAEMALSNTEMPDKKQEADMLARLRPRIGDALQAVRECDELTAGHIDAAARADVMGDAEKCLRKLAAALDKAAAIVRARVDPRAALAREVRLAFERHGLKFDRSKAGLAVPALEAILSMIWPTSSGAAARLVQDENASLQRGEKGTSRRT